MIRNHDHHHHQDPRLPTEKFKNYPLKRVTACVGWAVHGLVLEFANGCRTGRVLANNQREMGLSDAAITSRRVVTTIHNNNNKKNGEDTNSSCWIDIDPGDEIIRVTGFNLVHQRYLCHSIVFHLRSGKCIRFFGHLEGWRGTEFRFDVPLPQPGVLREVQFGRGRVLGLDFVETTLHLPIRKELVPTYPTELQWFIRKLVVGEETSSIPEDVWFSRIFPKILGAELMGKIRRRSCRNCTRIDS
jgi:hypothetical protein